MGSASRKRTCLTSGANLLYVYYVGATRCFYIGSGSRASFSFFSFCVGDAEVPLFFFLECGGAELQFHFVLRVAWRPDRPDTLILQDKLNGSPIESCMDASAFLISPVISPLSLSLSLFLQSPPCMIIDFFLILFFWKAPWLVGYFVVQPAKTISMHARLPHLALFVFLEQLSFYLTLSIPADWSSEYQENLINPVNSIFTCKTACWFILMGTYYIIQGIQCMHTRALSPHG